ncbi:MAG: glycerol-3-phosphate acyltransferase [Eubacterium sp.]|nr:glycerol-3-phosphate acyltransferase [Eubacterium sp.]
MMTEIVYAVIFLLVGYGFGSFSTGYVVGKMSGHNIQTEGSGNIGTTNALRTMGAKGGALTFAGDLLKAFIPTLLVRFVFCPNMGYGPEMTYLMTMVIGLGVVIGHNFPFYLHFKGGKGIAVSAAVIVASSSNSTTGWIMIGIGLALFIIVVAITRYVSLGSLIVVWYFPVYVILQYRGIGNPMFAGLLALALIFTLLAYVKHAGNIKRLLNHTERKLGEKKEKENE